MANKRKDRKRYSKGSREDYTKGGRVSLQRGGRGREEFDEVRRQDRLNQQVKDNPPASETPVATTQTTPETTTTTQTTTQNNQVQDQQVEGVEPVTSPPPDPQPFDVGFGNVQPGEYSDEQKPNATGAMKRATPVSMEDPAKKSAFDIGREYRILRTGAEAEEMARGVLPDTIPKIPDPKKIDRADTEITPEQAAE